LYGTTISRMPPRVGGSSHVRNSLLLRRRHESRQLRPATPPQSRSRRQPIRHFLWGGLPGHEAAFQVSCIFFTSATHRKQRRDVNSNVLQSPITPCVKRRNFFYTETVHALRQARVECSTLRPMKHSLKISTVTPVYSGEEYLRSLVEALSAVREEWNREGYPFHLEESIFVDDNAVDGSATVLQALSTEHPWIRVIANSRNFGQHPATIAGILHSAGDWIVTLDEDLQHDPRHAIRMLEFAVKHSLDIVYARPETPVHQSRFRDLGSAKIKQLLMLLTGNKGIRHFNSFRLIRGVVARSAASVCSHETYYDIALTWFTNRIDSLLLPMKDERFIKDGRSGYSVYRLLGHARRMIVSSQAKILRVGALVGFAVMGIDFVFGLWVLVQNLIQKEPTVPRGWASLFLVVLFFGGLSISLLSVILEYLTGIVLHIQGKPTFFIIDRGSDADAAVFFARCKP
jgi:glycosyltransferase involved in cell wall biosynthesis